MILRNDRKSAPRFPRKTLWLFAPLLAVVVLFTWKKSEGDRVSRRFIFCDMETVLKSSKWTHFICQGEHFVHGETRTPAASRSGKYSSAVMKGGEYGVAWSTKDIRAGDFIEVRVWRKSAISRGSIVLEGKSGWKIYLATETAEDPNTGNWEELRITATVPLALDTGEIMIYTWNPHDTPAYYDDLSINIYRRGDVRELPQIAGDSVRRLNILLEEKEMQHIEALRLKALQLGVLSAGADDWARMKLEEGKNVVEGDLRLKGDWVDHLFGDKWSFRVQLKEGFAWNRMTTFSLQSAEARNWINEWVYHQWLKQEDILSTRFDFVQLSLNNKSLGLYAYEEHFEKQLPEFNHRREGPIVKFSEEGFWELVERDRVKEVLTEPYSPVTRSSTIDAFRMKGTLADSTLRNEFLIAQNLMSEYKTGTKKPEEILDTDRMAKYFAIMDICQAWHGLVWHNQRFYYNPVTLRLEPIGFDGYMPTGPMNWIDKPFIGKSVHEDYISTNWRSLMFERLFTNSAFVEKYVHYLSAFSEEEYIRNLLGGLMNQINSREAMVRQEWPEYSYDRRFLLRNAGVIRASLLPAKHSSVKCHFEGMKNGKAEYRVYNYHCLPVRLLGVSKDSISAAYPFAGTTSLPAYSGEQPADFSTVHAAANANFVLFTVPGFDSVFALPVLQWKAPVASSPDQELFSGMHPATNELYDLHNDTVHFRRGNYTTTKDVLIPAGYTVIFDSGVTLDFKGGASFICKSTLFMNGTADSPIRITSSDRSARGFTLLQAPEKSWIRYVTFEHFKNLDRNGWTLTGAVTVYESECRFDYCVFTRNYCEDALNIIRSKMHLANCEVSFTQFDGFDSDFNRGVVEGCWFHDTGNDGMDFSGSVVTVQQCRIERVGDKCISVGEESNMTFKGIHGSGGNIGIASKDLSVCLIEGIHLKDVKTGFAAYKKKPEYGPGTLTVKGYTAENVQTLHSIELGSTLSLDGKIYRGNR